MATADKPTPAPTGEPAIAAFMAGGSATGTWKLDASRSRVEFHSRSIWGMVKVNGGFASLSGEGSVGHEGGVTGNLAIDASSLDSRNKKRDEHLRSKDFFDVTRHPRIVYAVDRISPLNGNQVEVLGTLTVLGQREPLPFTATVTEATAEAVSLEAELDVDRSRFGMRWSPLKMASLNNRIVVSARFLRGG